MYYEHIERLLLRVKTDETHGSSSRDIGVASRNNNGLVIVKDILVTIGKQIFGRTMYSKLRKAYIGVCSGPARMASLLSSLYFSNKGSPSSTTRSRSGFPTTTRRGVSVAIDKID